MRFSRSVLARVGAVAALVLAAAGTASVAQARSNVYFSVGANVAPGVVIGASNAPYYYPQYTPVYVQPQAYYAPPPVYYSPPVTYVRPAPVYYGPRPIVGVTYYYVNGQRYRHRAWNGHHYRYW